MASTPSPSPSSRSSSDREPGGLLGIGLDGKDGHKRVTTGGDFLIVGGSADTHERMQDLVIRMEEKLRARGKTMRELDDPEFDELVAESFE